MTEFVEEPEPDAPYGLKGIGEIGTSGDAGLVAALRDAVGRR